MCYMYKCICRIIYDLKLCDHCNYSLYSCLSQISCLDDTELKVAALVGAPEGYIARKASGQRVKKVSAIIMYTNVHVLIVPCKSLNYGRCIGILYLYFRLLGQKCPSAQQNF